VDSPWGWLCVLLLPGLWVLFVFNGLVNLRNQVRLAFSTIDVQLKKRHDLVPKPVAKLEDSTANGHEWTPIRCMWLLETGFG
jgi:LemA protein